jgi:predicted HicB family RNase H-like nuclease
MQNKKRQVRGNVRVPPELHSKLKRAAEKDRRSVNSMALLLIERGLAA